MSSAFDVDSFISQSVDQPFQTRLLPVPAGNYLAVVASHDKWVDVRTTDKGRVIADIWWEILDESVKQALSMETVRVRKSYFVDLTPDGRLDWGTNKNIALGQTREALGQNIAGSWSIMHLKGAGPAIITVTQRPDEDDASIIYNDVKAVVSPTAFRARAA